MKNDITWGCLQPGYKPETIIFNPQPKWISVKDQLPEQGIYYLVTDGEYQNVCKLDGQEFRDINLYLVENITHWMPLPEKP